MPPAPSWFDPENGHKTFLCHQCVMDDDGDHARAELLHLIHSEHITHGRDDRPEARLYFRCERGHHSLFAIGNERGRTTIHFRFDAQPRGTK